MGGPDPSGGSFKATSATFVPAPQVVYQIQPSNTYYIIPGEFAQSAIIDYTKIGNKVAVDFAKYPSSNVTIVHDSQGNLTIQAQ